MDKTAKYIWLPDEIYPEVQLSYQTVDDKKDGIEFCLAEFKKEFELPASVIKCRIHIFGDSKFRLIFNGKFIGQGPANNGGDFSDSKALTKCYYSTYSLKPVEGNNIVLVQVQIPPEVWTYTSQGHGCLIADIETEKADGTTGHIITDSSWLCRQNMAYPNVFDYFAGKEKNDFIPAQEFDYDIDLHPSPIPVLSEYTVLPEKITPMPGFRDRMELDGSKIIIKPGCPLTFLAEFDRDYACYPTLTYSGPGAIIVMRTQEFAGKTNYSNTIHTDGRETFFRSLRLFSAAWLEVTVIFVVEADSSATIEVSLTATNYPVTTEGSFSCSDKDLNNIYTLCKNTLEICRQSLHLDSPHHQEPLACTGDYFISSLMEYFCFGDSRLTHFDIIRTADFLAGHDGRMFHTSYSLILLQMIHEYYNYTGDETIFADTYKAVKLLIKRFATYTNAECLITDPPDYMFVDWVAVDGYDLHHPPKELGQTVLNAFYYKALIEASFFAEKMKDSFFSQFCLSTADKLYKAFNDAFWDEDTQLYISGQTEGKIYYSIQANTLAVLYGLANDRNIDELVDRMAIPDKRFNVPGPQPYFMHFFLEMIYKTGNFAKYGLDQIRRWKKLVDEDPKGLKEIWAGYFDCDYSHAWGGTPAYQLPSKLLGITVRNGFKEVTLQPCLYGLEYADIKVPTPYGFISAHLEKGKPPLVKAPAAIVCAVVPHTDS